MSVPHLIERHLSRWDVRSQHSIGIRAESSQVYRFLHEGPLPSVWAGRWLMSVRFFFGKKRGVVPHGTGSSGSLIERLECLGFVVLQAATDRECVLGCAGRFWRLVPEFKKLNASEFSAFHQDGYAKAVVTFFVSKNGRSESHLYTETRVYAFGHAAKRRLKLYWFFIEPFGGLIRGALLRAVAKAL